MKTKEEIIKYRKQYYLDHKEELAEKKRAYRAAHRQEEKARSHDYWIKHKDERTSYFQSIRENRAWMYRHYQALNYISKTTGIPPWTDLEGIKNIYKEADKITRRTGIMHHVDHIYPICNKNFCGLHVTWNLQIITGAENFKKGNKTISRVSIPPERTLGERTQRVAEGPTTAR